MRVRVPRRTLVRAGSLYGLIPTEPDFLAIVGSRDWPDLDKVWEFVDTLPLTTTIVSGGARGVDSAGEKAARRRGMPEPIIHRPDYRKWPARKYGKHRAPMERNKLIVRDCTRLVAFHYRETNGTQNAIDLARAAAKPYHVFRAG